MMGAFPLSFLGVLVAFLEGIGDWADCFEPVGSASSPDRGSSSRRTEEDSVKGQIEKDIAG